MPLAPLHPVVDGMKICNRKDCKFAGSPQPVANFPRAAQLKDGIHSQCNSCRKKDKRRWAKAHPDTVRKIAARTRTGAAYKIWRLKNRERLSLQTKQWCDAHPEQIRRLYVRKRFRQYGVAPEWYVQQLAAQNGGCGICGSTDPKSKRGTFHVDHDHRCCKRSCCACDQCRRGLLCARCNTRLGVYEKGNWIRKAMAYLREYEQIRLVIPSKDDRRVAI
jgi:hypothetical protein